MTTDYQTIRHKAIIRFWSGRVTVLAVIIADYAALESDELAMISMLDDRVHYKGSWGPVQICDGVSLRWSKRAASRPWYDRKYTIAVNSLTTRLITFDQLLPYPIHGKSWLDSMPRSTYVRDSS
jgi:hypothetical protein